MKKERHKSLYLRIALTVAVFALMVALSVAFDSEILLCVLGGVLASALIVFLVLIDKAKTRADEGSRHKSAFFASISHEIRTPMIGILGLAEMHTHEDALPAGARDAFKKIYESSNLLFNFINNVLDLSKIESGKMELFCAKYDIPSLINDAAQLNCLLYEKKPIMFSLNVDEMTPLWLIGDEIRIKQILNNVLSNAFKFTEEGKIELSVSVESEPDNPETITLVFRVSDTGQGMLDDQINRIFDEYTRFNLEVNRFIIGAGLGMSITKRLIDMMNGSIAVESELGKGSVFTVSIPQTRAGADVCGSELVERLHNFSLKSAAIMEKTQFYREYMPYGSVLVVDDAESNLYVARGMLASYGLRIETVFSAKEAIEKIINNNTYDIIFMDHMMPVMDGVEAVNIIRGLSYKNAIVAMTANAISGQAEMFMNNGFDSFIFKPIDSRELDHILNHFIRDRKLPHVVAAARIEQSKKNLP